MVVCRLSIDARRRVIRGAWGTFLDTKSSVLWAAASRDRHAPRERWRLAVRKQAAQAAVTSFTPPRRLGSIETEWSTCLTYWT